MDDDQMTAPIQPFADDSVEKVTDEIDEIRKLSEENATYKAGWQRAMADYKNLQRETEIQRGEWAAMSALMVLEDFLPVYTNFKAAFGHKPADGGELKPWQNWATGIGFIMKQFGDILKSHGVEEIKTVGEIFDPTKHEIVGEEAATGPEHFIIKEVEVGYVMKGRVIKVAKVIVSGKELN